MSSFKVRGTAASSGPMEASFRTWVVAASGFRQNPCCTHNMRAMRRERPCSLYTKAQFKRSWSEPSRVVISVPTSIHSICPGLLSGSPRWRVRQAGCKARRDSWRSSLPIAELVANGAITDPEPRRAFKTNIRSLQSIEDVPYSTCSLAKNGNQGQGKNLGRRE